MKNPASESIPVHVLTQYALLLGGAMIAAAWLWSLVFQGHGLTAFFPRDGCITGLLGGTLAGGAFAVAAWLLLDRMPSLRRIERLLTGLLDMSTLRFRHAVLLGLLAGIPEEILFRGALQPVFGLVITAAVFGALHAMTAAYFVYALVAGLLLGELAIWSGGLWAPIAAHSVIDIVMFFLLMSRWRRSQLGGYPITPSE
jgi:uncharacterized protein